MSAPQKQKARVTAQDIAKLPDNVIGEIIGGELVVSPRPTGPHVHFSSFLGIELGGPFSLGKGGGPGGWWILDEPEVELERDLEHYVPDLAGWRKERLPKIPDTNLFTVVPDWICEIISPASRGFDRIKKSRVYAKHGVKYYWIVDPEIKSLDVLKLSDERKWLHLGVFADSDKVRAEPFEAIEIDLAVLWSP